MQPLQTKLHGVCGALIAAMFTSTLASASPPTSRAALPGEPSPELNAAIFAVVRGELPSDAPLPPALESWHKQTAAYEGLVEGQLRYQQRETETGAARQARLDSLQRKERLKVKALRDEAGQHWQMLPERVLAELEEHAELVALLRAVIDDGRATGDQDAMMRASELLLREKNAHDKRLRAAIAQPSPNEPVGTPREESTP